MKKDARKEWILEPRDKLIAEQMYMDAWHETGELGGVGIWFNVFKRLIEYNGLEIAPKQPETKVTREHKN